MTSIYYISNGVILVVAALLGISGYGERSLLVANAAVLMYVAPLILMNAWYIAYYMATGKVPRGAVFVELPEEKKKDEE